MKLNRELFERIVTLLTPHMSESGRQTLITPLFSDMPRLYSQIDWSGSNRAFTVRLVEQLIDYGQVTPGQDALVLLLETLRGDVGYNVQEQIDGILGELITLSSVPPIPNALNKLSANKWRTSFFMGLGAFAIVLSFVAYQYIASLATPQSPPTVIVTQTPPPIVIEPTVAHENQCEYAVVVRDLATGDPIEKAKLTLEYQLDSYTEFTNSEGRYRGEFSCTETRPSYDLRVDAEGYRSYDNEYILKLESVKIYLISNAMPLCHHVMTVLDKATLAQISHAKVQLELGLYHTTGYTDSEGYYAADLPCTEELPSVKVRVSVADYEPYSVDYYLNDEIQEVRLVPK